MHPIPQSLLSPGYILQVGVVNAPGEIIKAPRPKDLFRNSIATPALVAAILNAKYSLAIPLDRQSKGFRSNGIDLSANTMANWVIRSSDEYLSLIYDKLHSALYDCSVIHADETPVKVMRIENQKISNDKKSYMWVYRSSPSQDKKTVILYDWQPSRRADHPRDFLKSFSGVVVTDGYQVYHKISRERKDLTIAGCWVHARRPFAEFIKSVGEKAARDFIAAEAYAMITEIMHLDNSFDDLPSGDRLKQRQQVLLPKVDAYFEWVKIKYPQVTHTTVL